VLRAAFAAGKRMWPGARLAEPADPGLGTLDNP